DEPGVGNTRITICAKCSKPIDAGRSGSITQWIFKPGRCRCENPIVRAESVAPHAATREMHRTNEVGMDDFDDDGLELPLSSEEFPTERYRPKKKLGSGAAGTVYLSRDKHLKKNVAVKILRSRTADQLIAFQEEARTTSKLVHSNI